MNDATGAITLDGVWGNLAEVAQAPGGMGHLNRTTTMEYDIAGRIVESTHPKSQTSAFEYNAVGQTVEATLPDETVTYEYGANGRAEEVTDDRGTTTMIYESGNDRVASVEDPVTGTVSYTYAPSGYRTGVTLPGGGTWTYTYRDGGADVWMTLPDDGKLDSYTPMLRKIEDDQGRVVEYGLGTTGGIYDVMSNITYQSGSPISYLHTKYELDDPTVQYSVSSGPYSRGLLTRIKNAWKSQDQFGQWQETVLVQNDYTHDDNGNRLTNTVSDNSGPIRTEEYGYDALPRLTGVDYDDGQTQTYTFDPMGNRTQKADSVAGTESYTYNNANMLLTRGANSYTNDLNGNTLTGGGRTNTWDGENRLTQCVAGSTTTSFVYGADGLRRRSTVGSTSTDYILDGQSVVRERQGSSNVATYLHGARGPEYRRNDSTGAVRWYLYDGLGSVLGEVDGSGNVTASRKYDVYGGVRASTGTSTSKHKFVGSLGHPSEDDTGLIYMRARYYDPVTGRFTSEDPGRDGNNYFEYARSRPTVLHDADGKRAETDEERQFFDAADDSAVGLIALAGLACLRAIGAFITAWTNFFSGSAMLAGASISPMAQLVGRMILQLKLGADTMSAGLTGARAVATIVAAIQVRHWVEYERSCIDAE